MAAAVPMGKIVVVGGVLITTGLYVMSVKQTRKSGKELSSDKPSWVNGSMVDRDLTAHENATKIMDSKEGVGNWKKGPTTEFNRILKWLHRTFGLK